MDPTQDELNGLSTLADVAAWAGTDGEVDEELMKALGKPTKLRDIAFINRAVWDRTAGALDLVGPTGHGYNSGNQEGPERIEAYMEHIKELHNRFGTEVLGPHLQS